MSYKDSFVYSLRQKVGDMRLITATVDVIAMNEKGEVKMVWQNNFSYWTNVGGHVELGDSWQGAAIRELYEEAGIVAKEADLELFATVSGPGRVYRYEDGSTQPFSLSFLCRKWEREVGVLDEEEISRTKWFSIADAKWESKNKRAVMLLGALEKYLETGKVQTVIE